MNYNTTIREKKFKQCHLCKVEFRSKDLSRVSVMLDEKVTKENTKQKLRLTYWAYYHMECFIELSGKEYVDKIKELPEEYMEQVLPEGFF